jgi:hypothetical protein
MAQVVGHLQDKHKTLGSIPNTAKKKKKKKSTILWLFYLFFAISFKVLLLYIPIEYNMRYTPSIYVHTVQLSIQV